MLVCFELERVCVCVPVYRSGWQRQANEETGTKNERIANIYLRWIYNVRRLCYNLIDQTPKSFHPTILFLQNNKTRFLHFLNQFTNNQPANTQFCRTNFGNFLTPTRLYRRPRTIQPLT